MLLTKRDNKNITATNSQPHIIKRIYPASEQLEEVLTVWLSVLFPQQRFDTGSAKSRSVIAEWTTASGVFALLWAQAQPRIAVIETAWTIIWTALNTAIRITFNIQVHFERGRYTPPDFKTRHFKKKYINKSETSAQSLPWSTRHQLLTSLPISTSRPHYRPPVVTDGQSRKSHNYTFQKIVSNVLIMTHETEDGSFWFPHKVYSTHLK